MTKQKKTAKRQRVGGRKSKWRPEFGELLVAAAREGKSLAEFAGEVGVTTQALRDWGKKHPAFGEALTMAREALTAWWERAARATAMGGGGNGTLIIFMLCNHSPEQYRQKQETRLSADGDLLAALRGIENE